MGRHGWLLFVLLLIVLSYWRDCLINYEENLEKNTRNAQGILFDLAALCERAAISECGIIAECSQIGQNFTERFFVRTWLT